MDREMQEWLIFRSLPHPRRLESLSPFKVLNDLFIALLNPKKEEEEMSTEVRSIRPLTINAHLCKALEMFYGIPVS